MAKPQQSNRVSQPGQKHQPTATASQAATAVPPAPAMASGQWSEWALHPSGLHYYRAQDLPYEIAARVVPSARNSIVVDALGRYIHYEFMGINEVTMRHYYPPPAVQPFVSLPATNSAVVPQQHLQVPELDDDGESRCSGVSGEASGGQQPIIDIDTTSDGLKFSFSDASEDHPIVLDKKTRKRLEAEKKRRVNTKAKVDTWLTY
ncbi:small nuclear ribonucleoprotein D3 [Ilyonectria robusta]